MKAVFALFSAVLIGLMPQCAFAVSGSPGGSFGFFDFVVIMLVVAVIFLFCREIVCWYWKINKATVLLTEIRDSLQNLSIGRGGKNVSGGQQCPSCGRTDAYQDVYNKLFCPHCKKHVNP
jgi:hypothetical protein